MPIVRIVKNTVFIIFLALLHSTSFASSNDSLRAVWANESVSDSTRFKAINKYYVKNTYADPDSVLLVIDYHAKLAKSKDDAGQMGLALNERAYAYYLKGDLKKSQLAINESIEWIKKLNNPLRLATVYSNLGNIHGEQEEYLEAVRCFNSSKKIFKEQNSATGEARIIGNLGMIYAKLGNNALALNNLKEAQEIYDERGKRDRSVALEVSIGEIYIGQENYAAAIVSVNKALDLAIRTNDQSTEANCYLLLAKAYYNLNDLDKALGLVAKSLEIEDKFQNEAKTIEGLILKANIAYKTDVNEATKQAQQIELRVNKETKNKLKVDLYELLYKCYKAQNKMSLSLAMHEKYAQYSDSLAQEKNQMAIIEEAIQDEFKEKLFENKLASEKEKARLKMNHFKKMWGIILVSLLLIGCIVFYARKTLLENRKNRDTLLQEIDRLKNISSTSIAAKSNKFELDKEKIEKSIDQKLNETDWNVLNILLDDPVCSNKEIAEKAFLSVDGIGSCLRRMYVSFDIKDSKYKKISLLMEAIKLSND